MRRRELNTLRNYVQDYYDERAGLCFYNSHLVWGHNHGSLTWLPFWVREKIVHIWNLIACVFTGHDETELQIQNDSLSGWPRDRRPCCVNCCSELGLSTLEKRMELTESKGHDFTDWEARPIGDCNFCHVDIWDVKAEEECDISDRMANLSNWKQYH